MMKRTSPAQFTEETIDEKVALSGRRERAKAEKKARLIAAARELFSLKGFTATTTSEIAERADIGAGTLFLYVPSKEALLVMVFQEDMTRVRDDAFATLRPRATLLEEIAHVYDAMCAFHEKDRDLARVYAKEVAFVREPNRTGVRTFIDGLLKLSDARVEAAKVRGEVAADVPAHTLSQNLFAIFFLHLQQCLGNDVELTSPPRVAALHAGFALQLRGIAAPDTRSRKSPSPATRARGTIAKENS
jgi:AcrR family transcriptional regulator